MEKMSEAELTTESCKAADYFLKSLGVELPIKEKQDMFNAVAKGFFMGVRWKEKQDASRE